MHARRAGSTLRLRGAAALTALALLTGSTVVSCQGDPAQVADAPQTRPASGSLGRWAPSSDSVRFPRECSREVHDGYFVVGPDGRRYPTWHAPTHIDERTGEVCFFGHEHGDNPADSALWNELRRHFAWDANGNGAIEEAEWNNAHTGLPFGYAAEYGGAPQAILHDSYKVALANGVQRARLVAGNAEDLGLRCQQLLAYAHDVHSAHGFGQARHPITYAIDCSGSGEAAGYVGRLIVSVMADFGSAAADPARTGEVGAGRHIATAADQVWPQAFVAAGRSSDLATALEERWDAIVTLRSAGGAELARINPGLVNRTPARYRLAAAAPSIDLCYSGLDASGTLVSDPSQAATVVRRVRGDSDCARLDPTGPETAIARRVRFDAREAQFKGCQRRVLWRTQSIRNGTGPAVWFTDASGGNARTVPFAGSLRQSIAVGVSATTVVLAETVDDASADCAAATGVRVRIGVP